MLRRRGRRCHLRFAGSGDRVARQAAFALHGFAEKVKAIEERPDRFFVLLTQLVAEQREPSYQPPPHPLIDVTQAGDHGLKTRPHPKAQVLEALLHSARQFPDSCGDFPDAG